MTGRYLRVIEGAEDHAEAHVDDAHNHRHLHLVGVEEREAVGGQVPNLLQVKGKKRTQLAGPKKSNASAHQ